MQQEEDDLILRNGERMRVPLTMMDALQRDVAQHFARITDGAGDSGLGLHRPGYRLSSTVTRDHSHYDQYEAEVQNAWKNPHATGENEGAPSRLKSKDAMPISDDRERAYSEYQNRIENAWRDGR